MDFLDAQRFVEEQNRGGMVLGLDAITSLLEELGNPQNDLRFIHLAGTNGKGSAGSYIANILTCSGYKVGRYVSPVILEYCERIQIMEGQALRYISEDSVVKWIHKIKDAIRKMEIEGKPIPTGFEIETAMAFLEFKSQGCDYVVLEAGLGGKEDATNVIQTTEIAVLTSISMDHMQILGDTVEKIAEVKAGIIKHRVPVVCYDYRDYGKENGIQNVIDKVCQENESVCSHADFDELYIHLHSLEKTVFSYKGIQYETMLLGENQPQNAVLAIEAAYALQDKGLHITSDSIKKGIKCTEWKGRFSIVNRSPLVIVDGAHNEDAAKSLARTLRLYFDDKKVTFVVGIFADKEYEKIVKLTADSAKKVYTIETENPRALSSSELAKVAEKYVDEVVDAGSVKHALNMALESKDDVIVCFGSLSFLGEVYEYYDL